MLIRRLKLIGLLVLIGAAGFGSVIWLQDAPLRDAESLLESGDAAAALKLIDTWEKDYGPQGRSQALRARCYVAAGRYAEAVNIFETVGPGTTDEIHEWARAYLYQQQWAQALPLLKTVRTRDADNADVLHELAACYSKLDMHDEALASARAFAEHKEYAHRAWLLIGMLLRDRGNKQDAADAWNRVSEFDPEYADLQIPTEEFLTQFASLEIELGRLEHAESMLEDALSHAPSAEAHFQAGLVANLDGRPQDAQKHWSSALEYDPRHLNALESLARVAIAAGDGARAEQILSPVLPNASLRSSTAYLMQRAAYLQGDQERARRWQQTTDELRRKEDIDAAVSQLLTENPNSYWAQIIRIYQFAERQNWRQAETIFDALSESDDEHQFVSQLRVAVEERGPLPATSLLPIQLF